MIDSTRLESFNEASEARTVVEHPLLAVLADADRDAGARCVAAAVVTRHLEHVDPRRSVGVSRRFYLRAERSGDRVIGGRRAADAAHRAYRRPVYGIAGRHRYRYR